MRTSGRQLPEQPCCPITSTITSGHGQSGRRLVCSRVTDWPEHSLAIWQKPWGQPGTACPWTALKGPVMAEQLIHGLAWLATHDSSAQQKPSHAFIALDAIGPQGSGSIQAQGPEQWLSRCSTQRRQASSCSSLRTNRFKRPSITSSSSRSQAPTRSVPTRLSKSRSSCTGTRVCAAQGALPAGLTLRHQMQFQTVFGLKIDDQRFATSIWVLKIAWGVG